MDSILLVFCLFMFACGGKGKESGYNTSTDITPILKKMAVYERLSAEHTKPFHGFTDYGCDSLLTTGLYVATGADTDLSAARDGDGKWLRRPLRAGQCYPDESASDISRDMYIGLFWGIWRSKNLELAQGIADYGEAHNWIMGEGDPTRTYLTPQMISTLYLMINQLGGKRNKDREGYEIIPSKVDGYQANLLVLHCLLRGEIDGAASSECVAAFKYQADRQTHNALFQAAYNYYLSGDQHVAVGLLLDESHWPADHLPSGLNHCSDYLWSRDESPKDWAPCDAGEYSGVDWLVAAQVLVRHAD